jgi:hypothetical protein
MHMYVTFVHLALINNYVLIDSNQTNIVYLLNKKQQHLFIGTARLCVQLVYK